MDETIRKLLDSIPERQPRSKLEPLIDVILVAAPQAPQLPGNLGVLQRVLTRSSGPE